MESEPYYQTFTVKGLPYGSSLWYEVSAYSSIGELGGKVSKWYQVKSDPGELCVNDLNPTTFGNVTKKTAFIDFQNGKDILIWSISKHFYKIIEFMSI